MRQKGFTLTEILIAMAIGLIVLSAIYAVVEMGRRTAASIEVKVAAGQDARAALELMAMEIQMASYNPSHKNNVWKTFDDMTSLASNQDNKGIQEATATSLTIEMDLNGNGSIAGTNNPNEVIRYEYVHNDQNRYITRSTNGGSAQAFLGDAAASTTTKTVRVINGDTAVFRYYNGRDQLITNPAASIAQIRRVEITLLVETDDISPDTGTRRRMTYTTSVIPRNHVSY